MIDTTSGRLLGLAVGPELSLTEFSLSVLAVGAEALGGAQTWSSFALLPQTVAGVPCSVTLRFLGERLAMLSLARITAEASADDAWSEEAALVAKARHDAWLAAQLGPPPYRYAWGKVESAYDPRSVSSSIVITYEAR